MFISIFDTNKVFFTNFFFFTRGIYEVLYEVRGTVSAHTYWITKQTYWALEPWISFYEFHDLFCIWVQAGLLLHCNEKSPEKELRGLSPHFHIHVSVSDVYIPRIGPHFSSRRIGRPMVGIYNTLTDTWMWKLGLRPHNFFSGIFVSTFRYCVLLAVCGLCIQLNLSSSYAVVE